VNLGIVSNPLNSAYINFGRWANVTTTIDTFAGSIDFTSGVVTGINLTSNGRLFIPALSTEASGYFNITGSQFDGNFVATVFGSNAVYDLKGSITAVPEPASLALLTVSGLALLVRARRRRAAGSVTRELPTER
jgi:hypothetical protein